jgi:serine protease
MKSLFRKILRIRQATKSTAQLGRSTRLTVESLEERRLMAGDLGNIVGSMSGVLLSTPPPPLQFSSFSVVDASRDDSPTTVFTGGALRVNYSLGTGMMLALQDNNNPPPPPPPLVVQRVSLDIFRGTTRLAQVGDFGSTSIVSGLVNLNGLALSAGTVRIVAHAYFTNGSQTLSSESFMTLKSGQVVNGDFKAQSFDINTLTGDGLLIHGRGGTDVLKLNAFRSQIASINGTSLSAYRPTAGGQAIYQGTAVDYVRLTSGRELYFTGIERLEVFDTLPVASKLVTGTILPPVHTTTLVNLIAIPNDPNFAQQWNLHVTDTADAWRFTQGSSKVLLVSLDTGVLPTVSGHAITGINQARLITDSTDTDNTQNPGHGHKAISVMIAQANDNQFHTGINWVSNVFVTDVYNGVNLRSAIQSAMNFANARGMKVVFQGGIQGESWLTSGGTRSQLEDLIRSSSNKALFAIAAGNGGPSGNLTDPNFMTSVSGVAKLQTNHLNVMSVGALQRTAVTSGGLSNASQVSLASYSNRGSNLTMVAPTDSPATNFVGASTFGGTSCANPNLAAMASLVWSVNTGLTAPQVRQILQSTALDIGAAGRDNTFGSGVVDTGRAVRRAVALARDANLANLAPSPFNGQVIQSAAVLSGATQLTASPPTAPESSSNDVLLGGGAVGTLPGQLFADESREGSRANGHSDALNQVMNEWTNGMQCVPSPENIGLASVPAIVTPLLLSGYAEDRVFGDADDDLMGLVVEDLAADLACVNA